MTWTSTPGSSHIEAFGYDEQARELGVRFRDGTTHFFTAPKAVHDGMLAAGSVGGYFAKNVRGKYPAREG